MEAGVEITAEDIKILLWELFVAQRENARLRAENARLAGEAGAAGPGRRAAPAPAGSPT